jgi:transposase
MARYKRIEMGVKLLPVDLARQIVPGSFEHALCHLIDEGEVDLSGLEARLRNDESGAPAYHPGVLLKIVLLAYSRGIVGSRRIEAACRENVLFMAISGDSAPHFTTVADFVSNLGEQVKAIFTQVLLVCERQALIGREMFAIDGVKLPSNASKARSGTRAEFQREARKMEKAVAQMLARHKTSDSSQADSASEEAAHQRKLERLKKDAAQIRTWLKAHPQDRTGVRGSLIQSNRTDNDSAKMATNKGVVQGYTGVATVDDKAQVILDAQTHGSGSEQAMLIAAVEATAAYRNAHTAICADAGYHSEAGLKELAQQNIDAYICDNDYRRRDARFKDQGKHRAKADPRYDKSVRSERIRLYRPRRVQACPGSLSLPLPGGQALVRQRQQLHHQRLCRQQVLRRAAGLRAVQTAPPVPALSAANEGAAGGLLWRPAQPQRLGQDEDEDRLRARQADDRATLRHGGTGVRQPKEQQAAGPLHAAHTQ